MRRPLFVGDTTFIHDNLYWNYPTFRFFAESILDGRLPLWNPFSHGGEPFYPFLFQMRFLDPLTVLPTILIGRVTQHVPIIFHWTRLFQCLFTAIGVYLVLRPIAKTLWVRLCLIPILLFTALLFNPLRQDGFLNMFLWVPYAHLFLSRIFYDERHSLRTWVGFAICVGVNWQSYFFVGVWIWIVFWLFGLMIWDRERLWVLYTHKRRALIAATLISLMALPNLAFYLEQGRYVFPLRMPPPAGIPAQPEGAPIPIEGTEISPALVLDYGLVARTGGSLSFGDILHTLTPISNSNFFFRREVAWGSPSDSILYIGLAGWALALFGILFGSGHDKKVWLTSWIVLGALALGKNVGLHGLLFPIFPPLWLFRNVGLLSPLFIFATLYFTVIGMNTLVEGRVGRKGCLFFALLAVQMGLSLLHFPRPVFLFLLWTSSLLPLVGLYRFGGRFWQITAFLAVLIEVTFHLRAASPLYSEQKTIEELLKVTPSARPATSIAPREVSFDSSRLELDQMPRYLELVTRHPTVFSPPFILVRADASSARFDDVRRSYRWNSSFLLRSYFDLIHSPRSSEFLSRAFGIKAPSRFSVFDEKGSPVEANIRTLGHNRTSLSFELNAPGFLYWSDAYDPQWEASLNGTKVSIQKSSGHFKEILLPTGKSTIDLVYRPKNFLFTAGIFYSVFGLGVALLLVPLTLFRPRKILISAERQGA